MASMSEEFRHALTDRRGAEDISTADGSGEWRQLSMLGRLSGFSREWRVIVACWG